MVVCLSSPHERGENLTPCTTAKGLQTGLTNLAEIAPQQATHSKTHSKCTLALQSFHLWMLFPQVCQLLFHSLPPRKTKQKEDERNKLISTADSLSSHNYTGSPQSMWTISARRLEALTHLQLSLSLVQFLTGLSRHQFSLHTGNTNTHKKACSNRFHKTRAICGKRVVHIVLKYFASEERLAVDTNSMHLPALP